VIVKSDFNGKTVYTRYYHLDPDSMGDLKKGAVVPVGAVLGKEGTDGGKYPQHVDLAVCTAVAGRNIDFSTIEDASPIMEEGVRQLHALAKANPNSPDYSDYKNKPVFKHGETTTS
jgi:hypothetical protein